VDIGEGLVHDDLAVLPGVDHPARFDVNSVQLPFSVLRNGDYPGSDGLVESLDAQFYIGDDPRFNPVGERFMGRTRDSSTQPFLPGVKFCQSVFGSTIPLAGRRRRTVRECDMPSQIVNCGGAIDGFR
jgi:hypothetical protein